MYSVLIQNKPTLESFQHFHPLFVDAMNSGQIGICQWLEAGKTVETALPELYDLIQDKEEWRAIIIRFADDKPMSAYGTVPENPYDFVENLSADTHVRESDIPLIRLTHMLGGIPFPQLQFESQVIREPNKAPRMVYRPEKSEADQEAYRQLSRQYRLDGPSPTEIILISLREHRDARVEDVTKVWTHRLETNSSDFWRRNGYPSICRFCFCEQLNQGPIQNTADLFTAWMSVLLLAVNDIDPSTLQAYRLHRLSVEFDRRAMRTTVQETAGRILSAREFLQKSIQLELRQRIKEKVPLPKYRLEAPVELDLPLNKDYLARAESFGIASRTAFSDKEEWAKMDRRAEQVIDDAVVAAERALDRTADRMRGLVGYRLEDVVRLDPYQREDMHRELSQLNDSIYTQRAALPVNRSAERQRMRDQAAGVEDKLISRLTRRQTSVLALAAAVLFLLTVIPGLVLYFTRSCGSLDTALLTVLGGAVVILLVILFQLLRLRGKLRENIAEYNDAASGVMHQIMEDGDRFSEYLGSIASYMHGQSYMSGLRHKVFLQDEALYYKRNHINALNTFLSDLREWSTAFHLTINFELADFQEYLMIDTDIAPHVNPLYTFEPTGSFSVDVNSTGNTVTAPFDFIEKLIIEREELYDDAG